MHVGCLNKIDAFIFQATSQSMDIDPDNPDKYIKQISNHCSPPATHSEPSSSLPVSSSLWLCVTKGSQSLSLSSSPTMPFCSRSTPADPNSWPRTFSRNERNEKRTRNERETNEKRTRNERETNEKRTRNERETNGRNGSNPRTNGRMNERRNKQRNQRRNK